MYAILKHLSVAAPHSPLHATRHKTQSRQTAKNRTPHIPHTPTDVLAHANAFTSAAQPNRKMINDVTARHSSVRISFWCALAKFVYWFILISCAFRRVAVARYAMFTTHAPRGMLRDFSVCTRASCTGAQSRHKVKFISTNKYIEFGMMWWARSNAARRNEFDRASRRPHTHA